VRLFGQPVTLSEVIAVIQRTAGVAAVDLDQLYVADRNPFLTKGLAVARPLAGTLQVLPAELLTVDPHPIKIEVMT
jgi:hypothetical protein